MMYTENENWKMLLSFLPDGWEEKARKLGAIIRQRKVSSAETLLHLLFIYLADGCSLRETAVRASESGLAQVSDVALLKRLKASSRWLKWMTISLLEKLGAPIRKPDWLQSYRVRIVDASIITEPGSTGADWRLHYSLELFGLTCDSLKVTGQEVGESFTNFPVEQGDLLIGDRAYGRKKGMAAVIQSGADFIVRLKNKALNLYDENGQVFPLLEQFQRLKVGQIGEWNVVCPNENATLPLRLIAVKKSPEAAERSIKIARRGMRKKQKVLYADTLALHRYFFLLTSVPKEKLSNEQILQLYRARWQVELAFKRLKSILGLGHLPKKDPEGAKAWMYGKLLVAVLAQIIVNEGRSFSPWGYRISGV